MRNIKFRAWDTVREEYLSAGKVMIQVLPGSNPKESNGLHLDTSNFMCAEGRMILEQLTGITDKNGSVVYEGDIIHSSLYIDDANHTVDYIDELGGYFAIDDSGSAEMLNDILSTSVVIGNIHQNPELLA